MRDTHPCRGLAYVLCSMLYTTVGSLPLLSGENCSKDSSPAVLACPCHPLQGLALSALASVPGFLQRSLVISAKKEETTWRGLKKRPHSVTPITSPQLLYLLSLLLHFVLLFLLHLPLLYYSSRHAPFIIPVFLDIASKWLFHAHLFPWVNTSSWPQLHPELLCSTLAPLALSWLAFP